MADSAHEGVETGSLPVRVLVTGGSGFVGSAIVRALNDQHPEWIVSILDKSDDPRLGRDQAQDDMNLLKDCVYDYVRADLTQEIQVRKALEQIKPDAVVHTAGIVPPLSERYSRRLESIVKDANVNGTRHLVEAAKRNYCRALVYTSSCCAVTDDMTKSYANIDESWPVAQKTSIYGESKVEAERIVIAANNTTAINHDRNNEKPPGTAKKAENSSGHAMFTCVLRPSVIFGEGDNQLMPPIHACIAKRETCFVIGNGRNLWDTVYVGNVADAHVLAVENLLCPRSEGPTGDADDDGGALDGAGGRSAGGPSAAGETFFIQNNEPISFREFSLAVWKEFGHFPPALEIPIPEGLGWILGLIAEAFTRISGTPTTLSRGSVMDACAMRYASGDKAWRLLGYRPRVGLEVGIKKSCQDYTRRLSRRQR